MVDYEFYTNVYLGTLIPQKAFGAMAARASEALKHLMGIYRVVSDGPETEKLAVCAMAESIYTAKQRRSGVSAASVGNVSVRYEDSEKTNRALWRELYEKASVYLDIYRGIGL